MLLQSCLQLQLLSFMATSSPECQLLPGEPLNIPFPAPTDVSDSLLDAVASSLACESELEEGCLSECVAKCE